MKNLIFCADGTWDGPENGPDAYPSNVLKLFNDLAGDLSPGQAATALEQERRVGPAEQPTQVAKYIHGVGDSGNYLQKLMGGSLGTGLIARLLRGYTFLSRNYLPGDRIFLVGFSRGAYRVAGLSAEALQFRAPPLLFRQSGVVRGRHLGPAAGAVSQA